MRLFWIFVLASLNAVAAFSADHPPAEPGLQQAIDAPHRSKGFIDRDAFRHPLQELEFFGAKPNAVVVEVWPGAGYWTEILAPYLRDRGTYYLAALPKPAGSE